MFKQKDNQMGFVDNVVFEPEKLFVIENVTDSLSKFEKDIPKNLEQAQAVYESKTEPSIDINENCNKPYSCAFYGYCSQHLQRKNMFDLYRFGTEKKWECYQKGIISFEDVCKAQINLSETQQRQVDFELDNNSETLCKSKYG